MVSVLFPKRGRPIFDNKGLTVRFSSQKWLKACSCNSFALFLSSEEEAISGRPVTTTFFYLLFISTTVRHTSTDKVDVSVGFVVAGASCSAVVSRFLSYRCLSSVLVVSISCRLPLGSLLQLPLAIHQQSPVVHCCSQYRPSWCHGRWSATLERCRSVHHSISGQTYIRIHH